MAMLANTWFVPIIGLSHPSLTDTLVAPMGDFAPSKGLLDCKLK